MKVSVFHSSGALLGSYDNVTGYSQAVRQDRIESVSFYIPAGISGNDRSFITIRGSDLTVVSVLKC